MKRKVIFALILGLLFSVNGFAEFQVNSDTSGSTVLDEKVLKYEKIKSLPIELTPDEKTKLDEIGISHKSTDAPQGPARNPAEWEPMTGAIIRWPLGIPVSLIAEMSEEIEVHTIVANSSQQADAEATYQSGGVNMDNVYFIIASTNSIWTRDYGPWFIFDGEGDQGIVDHIYNRPRPLDDVIPQVIGSEWKIPVYGMDLIHTGGNHMSDGLGISMSTRLVYVENPDKTEAEVDSIMEAYLGNDYMVLDYVESGGIHHIDCWAKFLNPTTILVKEVPPEHSSYELLNQRAEYLATQISSWGRPYTVVRIYCPSGTAYTNSIILNKKVLVPLFGVSADTTATRIYQEAMPGYEILGFYGYWYENDAIHCRIMGMTDRYMLFVNHIPLFDTEVYDEDYLVSVEITDHSETGLVPESLLVYYKTEISSYDTLHLIATSNPDSFYAFIPAQPPGTLVYYYIKAADSSGRVVTHPPIGEPGAHTFSVILDNVAPEIVSPDSIRLATYDSLLYYPYIYDPDDSVHQISYLDIPWWCTVQNDSLIGETPDSSLIDSFWVIAEDEWSADTQMVNLCVYICGDADDDGEINLSDVIRVANYYLKGGEPPPYPLCRANANGDDDINLSDVIYIANYYLKGGSLPYGCGNYQP